MNHPQAAPARLILGKTKNEEFKMNYATIKPRDIANGPGVRVSLFVSGCTHHCPGCFNQEAPQNQGPIVDLLRQIKAQMPEKSIWAFSGYLFDRDILSGRLGDTREYLSYLDVLVDGPFIQAKKNLALRFRGSENQRLIDVPASLAKGEIVLWEDWQTQKKGMEEYAQHQG